MAEEIERGLQRMHPGLRKTVKRELAATVAAVRQTQTANTDSRGTRSPIVLAAMTRTHGSTHCAVIPAGMPGSRPWMASAQPPPAFWSLDSTSPPDI